MKNRPPGFNRAAAREGGRYNPDANNITDSGLHCGNDVAINANPSTQFPGYCLPYVFESDTVDNMELGLKSTLMDGALRFNGSVYRVDWDDIQVRVLEVVDGQNFSVVVNGESANIHGLEASFSWIPVDNLVLSLDGHLVDSELDSSIRGEQGPSVSGIREGNELTHAPRWGIAARADMTWPLDNGMEVYAGVYLMARDGSYSSLANEPISKTSSYGQGNVRLGLRSGPWDFTVFARNVWDERGYVYQQGAFGYDQIGFGEVIYPRRVGVSVRYGF